MRGDCMYIYIYEASRESPRFSPPPPPPTHTHFFQPAVELNPLVFFVAFFSILYNLDTNTVFSFFGNLEIFATSYLNFS